MGKLSQSDAHCLEICSLVPRLSLLLRKEGEPGNEAKKYVRDSCGY